MPNQFLTLDEYATSWLHVIEEQTYTACAGKTRDEKKRFKAELMWALSGTLGRFPPAKMPDAMFTSISWDEEKIAARVAAKAA